MGGNSRKPTTSDGANGNQAGASQRATLGAAAALPLAAVPAVAVEGDDAELLRLEQAIMAIKARQDALDERDEAERAAGASWQVRRHIRDQIYALTDDWHRLMDQVIGTPATGDAGRRAKARLLLKWANLDADGRPHGDDGLPWSLARDVLGIAT